MTPWRERCTTAFISRGTFADCRLVFTRTFGLPVCRARHRQGCKNKTKIFQVEDIPPEVFARLTDAKGLRGSYRWPREIGYLKTRACDASVRWCLPLWVHRRPKRAYGNRSLHVLSEIRWLLISRGEKPESFTHFSSRSPLCFVPCAHQCGF